MRPAIKMQYTHSCSRKKLCKKPHRAIKDRLADRPSIPSIRFIAFMMNTNRKTVRGAPIQYGISYIPKNPYKLFIYSHDKGNRQEAMI